jgi:hypothetical protein
MRMPTSPLALSAGLLLASSLLGARPQTSDAGAVRVVPAVVQPGSRTKVILRLPSMAHAHSATLHYGFNGWNVPLSGPGAGQSEDVGNINYFKQAPMTPTGAGSFEVDIDVPADARALHFVTCWDACAGNEWDNNNGRDYSWPITFPFIGPILSWDETIAPTAWR